LRNPLIFDELRRRTDPLSFPWSATVPASLAVF
jgi:hypothetical protein